MKIDNISLLSNIYKIRKLSLDDFDLIYDLCSENQQYYKYCGHPLDKSIIIDDLSYGPEGFDLNKKYYIGFFDNESLVAVMDLLDGYPNDETAFIGFFMMNKQYQGKGVGSKLINELCANLKSFGFNYVKLGIDKENPQSNHFWKKMGFIVQYEVVQPQGTIVAALKGL